MSLEIIVSIIAFVYGVVVGSFLNVCIYRWPAEESIVTPPSHCPNCGTRLKAIDLVPLFSFLFLGRKCRYCHTPISWQYFTVELITGIVWVLTFLKFGQSLDATGLITFVVNALFLSMLIVAFKVDLEHFIIPDQVSIVGVALGIIRDISFLFTNSHNLVHVSVPFTHIRIPMLPSILGIVLCGGAFFLLAYISFYVFMPKDPKEKEEYEGAMGAGDVKLAAAIGAILGTVGGFVSFFVAVMAGAIGGITLMAFKAKADKRGVEWRTQIPFGPYMVLGAVVVLFFSSGLGHLWEMWVNLITSG